MKIVLFSLAALLAFAFSASAQVALRVGDVKIEKILPAAVKTPEYNLQGGVNKRSKLGDWLEIEVEFSTIPEMIDELTFTYKLVVGTKMLVGDVTHVNIPKGRDHYSVMYVSPRSLESVLGGKTMTSGDIKGVWIDVTHQGQLLGNLGLTKTAVPNLPQEQGKMINKSLTPFAPLYWDRYEAIKPVGR